MTGGWSWNTLIPEGQQKPENFTLRPSGAAGKTQRCYRRVTLGGRDRGDLCIHGKWEKCGEDHGRVWQPSVTLHRLFLFICSSLFFFFFSIIKASALTSVHSLDTDLSTDRQHMVLLKVQDWEQIQNVFNNLVLEASVRQRPEQKLSWKIMIFNL